MQIKDIMTKKVITLKAGDPIGSAVKALDKYGVSSLPVVGPGKKLVGIVAESDFFTKDASQLYLPTYIDFLKKAKFGEQISGDRKKQAGKLLKAKVSDIMTSGKLITVTADEDVNKAVTIFKTKKINSIPVVDDPNGSKLIGIVSLGDVIKLIK